ncbi:MAG: sigma factor [Cyanobacteria bacterium J06638_7]
MPSSPCRTGKASASASASPHDHRPGGGCSGARAMAASSHRQSNSTLLQRLGHSRSCDARLHWRNALVVSNLALVRMVANRESRRSGQPFDELYASGCLGLIRAVEGFDAGRGVALSTFAVPYIRGAMLQEQRDRNQPLHTPRRLRELQRRAEKLVEQRRGAGLATLSSAELAAALGCARERLEEAGRVKRALGISSLDQPAPGSEDDASAASWLDRLADPRQGGGCGPADPQRGWLRGRLRQLEASERDLLEGRWIDGLSWGELARQQGMVPTECRRRAEALLRELRGAAPAPQASASPLQASIASRAARAV